MSPIRRPFALTLALAATCFWILPPRAFAGREGAPYRGEIPGAGGTSDTGDTGTGNTGGDAGGSGDGSGDGSGGDGSGSAPPPIPGQNGLGQTGKRAATLDGSILWSWWWEHNKDRFLARATERGRINAGSIYYWFGAGAKFPPREIVPVSESQRNGVAFAALRKAATLKDESSSAVRAEACVALGRVGKVPCDDKDRKEGEPDNLVVRQLIETLQAETGQTPDSREIRISALLGLGMCGDPAAGEYLLRNFDKLGSEDKSYAEIAFGLLRYVPAIDLLVRNLPSSAGATNVRDEEIAAIHALGLYGPSAVEEMNKDGRNGIAKIEKLASSTRGHEPTVMQAVAALGRLQQERATVQKAFGSKSNSIQWGSILALGYYSDDEKEAERAVKLLETAAGKGAGQQKNFATLSLGELASRLDPNSKTRARILRYLQGKDGLETNDNYIKACASLALAVAEDRTAIPGIAQLLSDTRVDDYVIGAACLSLGLLRATDHSDLIISKVLQDKSRKADARGYALLGLGLMGDTTRMEEILKFTSGSVSRETERQLTLAMAVLGDESNVKNLIKFFSTPWKSNQRHMVSNAAFGLGFLKDQSAVEQLARLATSGAEPSIRALAVIALGYVGSAVDVNPLARCFENQSYPNGFGGWDLLKNISRIL